MRLALFPLCALTGGLAAQAPLAPPIENPSGRYLVWQDYRVEVNQYGGLGRDWPTPELVWQHYAILERKARANPLPPNPLRALLLILPRVEAVAWREVDGVPVEIGRRQAEMTEAEIRWALAQWRQFEDMVYVYSGGNAWLRTDVRILDEPLRVDTDENWEFWGGQQRDLLDRYLPFRRGDYQSYNSIFCSKGLGASPHGGTYGAIGGIRGCGTSDTAFYGEAWKPNRTGYVALHEWLNQQCSATSNMMPYPDGETLWNNYVLERVGYREDAALDDWPWLSMRRDTMLHIIRPGMWRRWSAIDPYLSAPLGKWVVFGPDAPGRARELSTAPADGARELDVELAPGGQINLLAAFPPPAAEPAGTWYLRCYLAAEEDVEIRLWAAADARFELWLDGIRVRDGWGWLRADDDGELIEKVSYLRLSRGLNTLVMALPDTRPRLEFRVRLCDAGGSGRPPAGVRALVHPARDVAPHPLAAAERLDFRQPRLHSWAEVGDQPWTLLPRLGEAELRELTGVPELRLRTEGAPRRGDDGELFTPPQHLFLEVPAASVSSPWSAAPAEDRARLDNDLDFNWESMAWLRLPARDGAEKDVLLLRFDVAEPLLHLLRTAGRPADRSLVGWILEDHKLAYVVLVDLAAASAPATELGLLPPGAVAPR